MCGRFALSAKTKDIEKLMPDMMVKKTGNPSFNISPFSEIPIIYNDGGITLNQSEWGLNLNYKTKNSTTNKIINSRLESLNTKSFFKNLFINSRCLIPASGYYEWKKVNSKSKLPYYIKTKNADILTFAGICTGYEEVSQSLSCSIITVEPQKSIEFIHNRMPLIIGEKYRDLWLNNKELSKSEIDLVLNCGREIDLDFYSVSIKISNPKFDCRDCIVPIHSDNLFDF
jgi:putative SOS response-associated peptidase YedK